MPTPCYVLNLSPAKIISGGAELNIELSIHEPTSASLPDDFLTGATTIRGTGAIPYGREPEDDPVVLYIVAHGVPDGIKSGRRLIGERELAKAIIRRRNEAPTLIVWDVCFAESFRQIARLPDCWTQNYVHIFCCEKHERTWQLGAATQPAGQTLFSKELREALGAVGGDTSWAALEHQLQAQLGSLQTPTIYPKNRLRNRFALA